MKNFIYSRLLGLNIEALTRSNAESKRYYLNLGYSLLFVALLSLASGVKIMTIFTGNPFLLALGGMITFGIVFFMDYILVSSSSTNLLGALTRIAFGLLNAAVSATCLLLLINNTDIEDYKESISKNQIKALKDDYKTQYNDRYKVYNQQVKANEKYRDSVVEPEALNGFAGEKYEIKNAPYLKRKAEIQSLKKELDSIENSTYRKEYQEELDELNTQKKMGIFEQIDIMFSKVIPRSTSSKVLGYIIIVFLIIIELSVLIYKFSKSKTNNYNFCLSEVEKFRSKLNTVEMYMAFELEKIQFELNNKKEEIIIKTDFQAELGSMKKGIDEINKDENLPNLDSSLIDRELNSISIEIDNDINIGIKSVVSPTINDVSNEDARLQFIDNKNNSLLIDI